MKLKTFEQFGVNEELKPSTYDSISRSARSRGDSRGRRVANQAKDLKFREYTGKSISFKKKGSKDTQTDKIAEVDTNNYNWVSFFTTQSKTNIIFKMSADELAKNKRISAVDDNGNYYEVDRKTANMVTKAFDVFCKKEVSGSSIAQI